MTHARRLEIQAKYRDRNRDRLSAYNTSERGRLLGRARNETYRRDRYVSVLLAQTRFRAKALGLPFDLTPADISVPAVCPVLGIPIVRCGARTDGSPSIDRVIPALGYVRSNVRIISWRANRIKSNASPSELESIAAWVRATAEGRQT